MTTDLTKGNPLKLILFMSLPIMLGNLFQQLYSTVDAVIVGRYLGSQALASVGATTALYFLIIWFVCGTAGGFAVVIAQHFGAGETDKVRSGVCIALELSFTITFIVMIASLCGLRRFLVFIQTPEEILEGALTYLTVIVAGMAATMFYNICAAILRAMGDSKTPFVFIIISSVLNVILDILFIGYFNMGIFGAAFATIISQAFSGILCAVYMYKHFEILKFTASDWKFDWKRAKQMLSYGIPSGLCGMTTALGILVLQVAINTYGTTIIAAYTAAINVQGYVEIVFNAFSTTMINYAGQNLGAGNIDHLHKGFVQCIIMCIISSLIFGVLFFFGGGAFVSLYVKDNSAVEIIAFATKYLRYVGCFFIPFSYLLVTRSSLQGMGFRSAPVIIGITETICRVLFTIYLFQNQNETLLCLVSPLIWCFTSLVLIFMYSAWIRHLRKICPS